MGVWTPLGGLALLAFISLASVAALAKLPGKLKVWVPWAGGIFGGLCATAAGFYATQTWIHTAIGWAVGIHPIVTLGIGLTVIYLVWKAALAIAPDDWISVSITTGLVTAVFFLPSLAQALPAGDVGDLARKGVTNVTAFAVNKTDGWFEG